MSDVSKKTFERILDEHVDKTIYGLRVTALSPLDIERFRVIAIHDDFVNLKDLDKNVADWYHRDNGALQVALESRGVVIYRYWFYSKADAEDYLTAKKKRRTA